jgi:hypothetical protein
MAPETWLNHLEKLSLRHEVPRNDLDVRKSFSDASRGLDGAVGQLIGFSD